LATLLVALAHPDDETFGVGGVMARAVDEGHRVVVVCATRGEAGEIADAALATPETLGEVRELELRAAARAFGVTDVRFLGHRDSGMAGTPENQDPRALVNAEPTVVVSQLAAIIREVRPDVVVTFEPRGIYGHPDHMTISVRVSAAVEAAASSGPGHQVARLYQIAVPKSAIRDMKAAAEQAGAGWGVGLDVDSAPDDADVIALDATPWIGRKLAAIDAHATQRGTLDKMPKEFRDRMFATEWFVLAGGSAGEEILAGL
jgi:N-acetyl-1-D-myo-inositol-2-amino-2-deoxy-alpha-D-glucopyranoside deacetylase